MILETMYGCEVGLGEVVDGDKELCDLHIKSSREILKSLKMIK